MNGKRKHIPTRMCAICREKFDKRQLVRLVVIDNSLTIDPTGKQSGRGAYLCQNPVCWQRASQTNLLSKALRTEISAQDRENLLQMIPVKVDS